MQILDGKLVAKARRESIRQRVEDFKQRRGRVPGLSVILVGEDPASQVYVANKIKACEEVGIASQERRLQANVTPAHLKATIDTLNADPTTDGILLQLPLPGGFDAAEAMEWIVPEKDVDCLTSKNQGRLWSGRPLTIPCTPWGVMVILEHYKIPVAGRHAVVIGRSAIVGRPMAHLLMQADATVTICHSKTKDLAHFTRQADILVVAAGRPEFIGSAHVKKGAVVIDVGMHRSTQAGGGTKLVGDVRFNEVKDLSSAITKVPGGVGPMTITMLLENTLQLAERRQ